LIKVLLSGCNGKMGHFIANYVSISNEMEIVAGIDSTEASEYNFPIFTSFKECNVKAEVIIDFSHHSLTNDLINYALKTNTPAVICTTGLDESQEEKILEASKKIAIFRSGNMSLGINLVINLAKKATEVLQNTFDIEIIEKHHNRKVDAPSGTAYMIAEEINETLNNKMNYNFGRYGRSAKRTGEEIGIHAIRGGTIVGEHSVIFAGMDEIIEIKHTALSRNVFAMGAIKAAKYIAQRKSGLFDMNDLLNS